MIELASISDDWMQEIFKYLTFGSLWRLRRCSRKWRWLLMSKYVTETIALDNSDVTMLRGHYALLDVRHLVRTVVCSGITGNQSTVLAEHNSLTSWWNAFSALCEFYLEHEEGQYQATRKCHVVVANTPRVSLYILRQFWRYGAIASLELRNVSLSVAAMFRLLSHADDKNADYPGSNIVCTALSDLCRESIESNHADLTVHISRYKISATSEPFLIKLVLDNLPLPTLKQMLAVNLRFPDGSENRLRAAVALISARYRMTASSFQEDLILPIDYAGFHPVILWYLTVWNGPPESENNV